MPSEWLGVHGGRSYGPSPRGSSIPGPAVSCWTRKGRKMDMIERWIYHDTRKNNVSLPLFDQRVAVLGGAYIICEKMFLLIFRIECLNNEGSPLYTTVCSIYSFISFYLSPTYTYTEHYVLARLLNATAAVLNDFRSDTESQTSVLRG